MPNTFLSTLQRDNFTANCRTSPTLQIFHLIFHFINYNIPPPKNQKLKLPLDIFIIKTFATPPPFSFKTRVKMGRMKNVIINHTYTSNVDNIKTLIFLLKEL